MDGKYTDLEIFHRKHILLKTSLKWNKLYLLSNRDGDAYKLEKDLGNIPIEDVCISALSVQILFYVLEIKRSNSLINKVNKILDNYTILLLNTKIVSLSRENLINDFEDAIQYFTAVQYCDIILTKDTKEFLKLKRNFFSKIKIIKK